MKSFQIRAVTGTSNIFFDGAPLSEYYIDEFNTSDGVNICLYINKNEQEYDKVILVIPKSSETNTTTNEEYKLRYMKFIDRLCELVRGNKKARYITIKELNYEFKNI